MSTSVADLGGWSFLQAITNNSQTTKDYDTKNDKVYVHPLVKRCSSWLSEKSLEMCTESLGSETGSGAIITEITNKDESSLPSLLSDNNNNGPMKQEASKLSEFHVSKKSKNHCRSFPPPLTSISGSSGVHVRPHREAGRLVLEAVPVPSNNSLFHAVRSDGRLMLHLVHDKEATEEEEEEEFEQVLEEKDVEHEAEKEVEEEVATEAEEEEEEEGIFEEEDDWNSEVRFGKLPRATRCMEGGHGKRPWEPVWVSTFKLSV